MVTEITKKVMSHELNTHHYFLKNYSTSYSLQRTEEKQCTTKQALITELNNHTKKTSKCTEN